ncbi:MAG TPA: phosphate acyltransferase PlsX [bacterium]
MKIALDAMGGDMAPRETVQGAVLAIRDAEVLGMSNHNLEMVLVGKKEEIEKELANAGDYPRKSISIVDAREVVEMGESPAQACKQKRDSSIVRCAGLVKTGEVAATISAGNSGAAMAAALMMCGRIDGVLRPAIVTLVPSINGFSVLVDAGANVDCKAKHLLQFALMGDVLARTVLNFKSPRVGLLSIGEEETKGNELVFETQILLKKVPLNYIGNVEGRDIVNGNCDVTVCDGFVGNVALKAIEGVGELVFNGLSREIKSNLITLIGGLIARPAFKRFKKHVDWKEFGGAPLLGIDGLNLISHGKSNAYAIKNAIRMAVRCVNHDMNGVLKKQIADHGQVTDKPQEKTDKK